MSDLTDKFTALETQLSTQHGELMTAIGGLDTKLNTIAARMFWDNGEDTFTLAQLSYLSLLQLQAIKDSNDSLVTRSGDIYDTLNGFYDEYGDMRSKLTNISNYLFDIRDNIGYPLDADGTVIGRLIAILASLGNVNTALGIPSGDAATTMLGRLTAIQSCTCRVASTVPTPPTSQFCAMPFTNTGLSFYPTWSGFGTGVNVAVWSEPLPDGVTFGTEFGITVDNTELILDGGWLGAHIWVQSTGPNFGINPLSTVRFPTNQWVNLPDVDSISVSVGNGESIQVYLCLPTTEGDCLRSEATIIFSGSNAGNWDSGPIDVTGVTGVWFGASSHPYVDGVATLFVDDVPIISIAPPPDGGQDVWVAISGTSAKLVYSDGTAAYMSLAVCPE